MVGYDPLQEVRRRMRERGEKDNGGGMRGKGEKIMGKGGGGREDDEEES